MDRRAGDRHFMELAVGEMLESRSEHSRKPDPLVGAVIVDKDGTLLGKTHRASIREGAHAEYLLIDNLLHDVDLEGATLYVTLEPCTNRSQHFTPCVDRILSARISRVFIGIPDPNPRIEGHGIVKLANAGVQVDFFDSDLVEKIRLHNRDFIDYFYDMESDEGYDLSEFVGPSKKEREIVGTSDLAGLSLPHIMEYVAARQADLTIPSRELWKYMAHSGLVAYDSHILSYRPTIAGLLLFGQNPENFLVQSPVLVEAHIGDQVISEDICGPLLDMPQAILDFLSRHMRWFTEIHGLKRVTVPEYPSRSAPRSSCECTCSP
jgi:ATP-dependent DNA helicase RecG